MRNETLKQYKLPSMVELGACGSSDEVFSLASSFLGETFSAIIEMQLNVKNILWSVYISKDNMKEIKSS